MTGRNQIRIPNDWKVHEQIFLPRQYTDSHDSMRWNSDLTSQKDDQDKICLPHAQLS